MKLNIDIDQIVLEGFSFSPHDRSRFGEALRTELTRLLAGNPVPAGKWAGLGRVPVVKAGAVDAGAKADPVGLGQRTARAVYGGLVR